MLALNLFFDGPCIKLHLCSFISLFFSFLQNKDDWILPIYVQKKQKYPTNSVSYSFYVLSVSSTMQICTKTSVSIKKPFYSRVCNETGHILH